MEALSAAPEGGRPRSPKPADDTAEEDAKLNVVMPPETLAAEQVYSYFTILSMDGRSRGRLGQPEGRPLSRKLHPCADCGRRFVTSSNLSRHRRMHRLAAEGGGERCSLCGKLYLSASALQMHMLTHRPRHACGVCGRLFSRLWSVKCHLRSHTNERSYVCAHCGKKFADRANLRAHLQTHMRKMGVPRHGPASALLAPCPICQRTFSLRVYLTKHLLYCLQEQIDVDEDECGSAAGVLDFAGEVNVADLLDKVTVADIADEENVVDIVDKGNLVGLADEVNAVDLVDKGNVVDLADEVNVVDLVDKVHVVDLTDEVNVVDLEDEDDVNVVD